MNNVDIFELVISIDGNDCSQSACTFFTCLYGIPHLEKKEDEKQQWLTVEQKKRSKRERSLSRKIASMEEAQEL